MKAHSTVFERNATWPATIDRALAGSKAGAFWLDDVHIRRVEYPSLVEDETADLVIVGGGYAGLWTALRAVEREPGLRIVLLEAETIGWAASGRNGGFCEASLTHGDPNGRSRWPKEMETLTRLGIENLDEIEQTIARYEIDCDFVRSGILAVATEPHQVDWLTAEAAEGHDEGFLDQAAVQHEIASPTYLAGWWERDGCATLHPAKLAIELARVIAELGVTVHEHTTVRRIDDLTTQVDVVTDHGTVRTPRVALATNAFPSLLKRNRLMTIPMYDFVLATQPLTQAQLDDIGWQNRQGVSDLGNRFHYYRMTADDRIVFGGGAAIYHPGRKMKPEYEDHPDAYRTVASDFLVTFPQLEGIRFSHHWGGAIDTDTRFCAFFGVARGGKVAYAAGFTGLGVAAARFAADVMLDQLSGLTTERTELQMVKDRPWPFPPEPAAAISVNVTQWSLKRADHRQGRRNIVLKTMSALGLGFET